MKQPKLEDIIKLNEINCYLNTYNLIKLSLSCKKFRKLLSSEVFGSFNFREFVIHGKYKSDCISKEDDEYKEINKLFSQSRDNGDSRNVGEEEDMFDIGDRCVDEYNSSKVEEGDGSFKEVNSEVEDSDGCEYFSDEEKDNTCYILNPYSPLPESFLESKAKFQSDLKQISYQPTKLNLFNIEYFDYLLYDLPNVFLYVKSLIIKDSNIQFEAFQYLLDNLTKLEVVELYGIELNIQEFDKNNYTINWPLNLKELKIGWNTIRLIKYIGYSNDYVAIDIFGSFDYESDDLFLEPNFLPNLHTLVLEPKDPRFQGYAGDCDKYLEFVKVNSHIKKLNIGFNSFKPEFFEFIRNFNNLTELRLSFYGVKDIDGFKGIKSPALANLKNLSLHLFASISILPIIARQFPSIAKLNIIWDFSYFDQLKIFSSEIQAFKSLKALKLKIFVNSKLNDLNFLNLKIFKGLEILWRKLDDMDEYLKNLVTCPNLKNVIFNVIKFEEYEFYPELNPESLPEMNEYKRFLPYPHRISFYKFNQ